MPELLTPEQYIEQLLEHINKQDARIAELEAIIRRAQNRLHETRTLRDAGPVHATIRILNESGVNADPKPCPKCGNMEVK